jgi:hypothetical protein
MRSRHSISAIVWFASIPSNIQQENGKVNSEWHEALAATNGLTATSCFDARLYPICPRNNPKNWSFWHSPGTETGVILFMSVADEAGFELYLNVVLDAS